MQGFRGDVRLCLQSRNLSAAPPYLLAVSTSLRLPQFAAKGWGIACLALALGAAAIAADLAPHRFDLPADVAEVSLKRLAVQSAVEVLFATEMTSGLRTPAVRGEYTALDAANRLLAGTGLVAVQNARTGTITINRGPVDSSEKNAASRSPLTGPRPGGPATENPHPGETGMLLGKVTDAATGSHLVGGIVAVPGTDLTAIVGTDGTFSLRNVPTGTATVTITYVGYPTGTFSATISPGTPGRLEAKLAPEVVRMSAFVVEGAREGQARAINQQRAAINLRNVVAADAIGNFPDVNAAEALKRLPGLSTVRQRGEDRDITIRGAAPNLNAITLDGVSVLSNQVDGRTVSLDVFPAEQLAGVEVTKSATPNLDADSIGGVINLRSKSAFDTPRRVLSANSYWQYSDLAAQSSYRAGVNFSDVLGTQRDWGVQFSASRAQRKSLEETSEPAGWAVRSGTASNGAYAGYSPNNVAFTYVDIKRERTGGSAALERKFGDSALVFLRASHNEFIERNARPRFVVQNAGTIANTAPVTVADGRITAFTSTALRGQRVLNPRQFTDTGSSLALGGRATLEQWKLEWVGALSRGTNHQDAVTGQWQTASNTTGVIDFSDSERPRFLRTAGPDLNDASLYAFNQLQIQDRRLRNREASLKGDVQREFKVAGQHLRLSTGFKLRWSPKRWDQENEQYNSLSSGTLALSDPRLGGTYEVQSGFLDGLMAFGPTSAGYAFFDFAKANRAAFVPNAANTLQNTLAADYYVSEGIQAGYAMAEWNRGSLTALAGLRYERTATEAKGYRQNTAFAANNPARYSWVRDETDYADVLPGLHLRYAPTKRLVVRAAWNETIARPQTNRIAPSLSVTVPTNATESDRVSVSGGNPALQATQSRNFDFSIEYYLQSIGIVSAGYFHKDLAGPIYRRTFDGTYEGQPARFTVFDNAGKARVSGWEFVYQQQWSALPSPFDGLGVYANFTLVGSAVTLTEPGRVGETLPLFNQSDQLGNLALTYQKYGVFVRLSHNWRGDFLQALGNGPGLDQFARGFESYDLLASYKFNPRWTVKLEATNLAAAPEQQYVGTSPRNLYYGDTGRSYAIGVVWNY